MTTTAARRATRTLVTLAALVGGLIMGMTMSTGQSTHEVSVSTVSVSTSKARTMPLPPRGYVRTSAGRLVRVDTKDGCFTLRFTEARVRPFPADPGDGAVFCER